MSFFNLGGVLSLRALDQNGNSVSGAQFFVYLSGTTTPVTTYTDNTGATTNAFPVVGDAAGAPENDIYTAAGTYTIDVQDALGASLPGWPLNDILVGSVADELVVDLSSNAEIATSPQIVAATTGVRTLGYSAPGDGGGALGVREDSEPADPELKQQSSDGSWFKMAVGGRLNILQAGADKTAATDSLAAIQAAVDANTYVRLDETEAPAGNYTLSGTLHLNYGDEVRRAFIRGAGAKHNSETSLAGTLFTFTNTAGPCVAVTAGRYSGMSGITLRGAGRAALDTLTTTKDRTLLDVATWNTALTGVGISTGRQNAPYALFAVDPYSGTAPATPYPDVGFPAFTGLSAQYGKAATGTPELSDSLIEGGEVGILYGPNDDNNKDFGRHPYVTITQCVYGLSVGSTQSRVTDGTRMNFGDVHTCFVNAKHGNTLANAGRIGAAYVNVTGGGHITQIFDLGAASTGGTLALIDPYFESLFRIGTISGDNSFPALAVHINGGVMNFHTSATTTDQTVVGASLAGTWKDQVVIENARIQPRSVVTFGQGPVTLTNNFCDPDDRPTKAYQVLCLHALSGGFVPSSIENPSFDARMTVWSSATPTSSPGTGRTGKDFIWTSRDTGIPHGMTEGRCEDVGSFSEKQLHMPLNSSGTISSVSRSDRAITLTSSNLSNADLDRGYRFGCYPGCTWVFEHETAKTVCFIRSADQSTGVIVMEMQNNYYFDGSNYQILDTAFDPDTASYYAINGLVYAPERALFGEITSGSNIITNVRDVTNTTPLTNYSLAVGDRFADVYYNLPSNQAASNGLDITAIDTSARTITIRDPFTFDYTGPLNFWFRTPPANEASR